MKRRTFLKSSLLCIPSFNSIEVGASSISIHNYLMNYEIEYMPSKHSIKQVCDWYLALSTNLGHFSVDQYVKQKIQSDYILNQFELVERNYRSKTECMIGSYKSYYA